MRCTVCKKTSDEIELFKGILVDGMVMVCDTCAEKEKIPIIKKPSESQLSKADERYTVRERMERMSGTRDTTEISDDQIVTQGNIAKLRVPAPKQHHEDILDNYYWTLNIARRRKKLSITQLAEKMQVTPSVIQGIEKGRLPDDFEELFIKLEAFLGIKLLKNHNRKINFTRTVDEQKEILKNIREKMGMPETIEDDFEENLDFKEKISKGEIDFSKREELSDVTLDDLVDMKKRRERNAAIKKVKDDEDAMLGDDLDLDLELL
jgi:ribosome-binding protein aMBF1 (putative translation factor)